MLQLIWLNPVESEPQLAWGHGHVYEHVGWGGGTTSHDQGFQGTTHTSAATTASAAVGKRPQACLSYWTDSCQGRLVWVVIQRIGCNMASI